MSLYYVEILDKKTQKAVWQGNIDTSEWEVYTTRSGIIKFPPTEDNLAAYAVQLGLHDDKIKLVGRDVSPFKLMTKYKFNIVAH